MSPKKLPPLLSDLPPPGTWGEPSYWPFSYGTESNDQAVNNDMTTLMRDYNPAWAGQPGSGDDIGPVSRNVEDRRGQPYIPLNRLQELLAAIKGGYLDYPGRVYGPYDEDIDASLRRAEQLYAISPTLRELDNRERWFQSMDRGEVGGDFGPEPPKRYRQEHENIERAKRKSRD